MLIISYSMEQIELLEKQINTIGHDVNQMRQELHNTIILLNESNAKRMSSEAKVDRLLTLLEGDPIDRDRGLIPRLKNIEDFVSKMKDTRAYLAGNLAATIFIISAAGGLLALIYKIYLFFTTK